MKPTIRAPFFETSVKNYIWGDECLAFAIEVEAAAKRHDVDALFIAPYTEIRRIREHCPSLILLAPYMDILRPGRGMADVLPEAVRDAGAQGVVINHVERPMTLSQISQTIQRARELDMLSFACADTIAEARAMAQLGPDILNPEPSDLIGSGQASDLSYVREVTQAVKAINPDILVEQAAGITTADQIYEFIMAGSEGAGSASGILKSPDPIQLLDEMVAAVRRAADDLEKRGEQA